MRALDIMSRPVVTVRPLTPVGEAAATLTKYGVTALPVIDDDECLVGIVSEGDLLWHRVPGETRAHLARRPDDGITDPPATVGDVMTTALITVPPDATAAMLSEVMLGYDIHSVPVVDGTAVIGIVSRRDLLSTLLRQDDVIAGDIHYRLDEYAGQTPLWGVDVADGVVTITGTFQDDAERAVVRILATTVPGVTAVRFHPHRTALAASVS
jgi:CBS domain-containing protein